MKDEIKEITKVDKELLDKIKHILASELNCDEYDAFYNYFNEIRKPNILIDIKDDKNIKDYITNLQEENERLNNIIYELEKYINEEVEDYNKVLNSKLLSESGKEKYEAEKVCFLDMLDKLNELKGDNK